MDSRRWERVQALFHEAADRPVADQRAFLESVCGDDPDLIADVLAMLDEDARRTSILDHGIARLAHDVVGGPAGRQNLDPAEFQPYRLKQLLGEGGMGVVYLAEREDLGSSVAIKILRDAWLSSSRRKRFAVEQRTLAQLNHPGIARLYDAHTLSDGTPWFVMEYVDGAPLSEYCARNRCTVQERLTLFRAVCEAVHYAHEHGVIHRDLKPSNILVKRDGTVRLLDFGIAKQLDSFDPDASQARTTMRFMTPAYAAPEQLRGEPAGVHTDIYSLGVVLYELVAGRLPFDLSRTTSAEAAMSTTQEPAKPSIAAREAAGDTGARFGRGSTTSWADLDVLCLTCMHKDAKRRYASVDALIRDIDHFLRDQPLEARPDTVAYTLGKFLRRRWRIVSAAAVVLFVVGGLALLLGLALNSGLPALGEAASAEDRTVAVLPLRNENGNTDVEFLRQAIAEEIATNLSYTASLSVRPFATTSGFTDSDVDARAVGARLGVANVVTGIFDGGDDSLRVRLRAIAVEDGRSLWEESFTVRSGSRIELRERIATVTSQDLAVALGAAGTSRWTPTPPRSEEAYDLYLRSAGARYDPGQANADAIAILERAIALDSTYAPALLALSRRLYVRSRYETGDESALKRAVALNERAVRLDPGFVQAWARLAALHLERGELVEAWQQASALVRRRSDSADAHWALSYVLRFAGMLDESAHECATALALDPHNFGWRTCAVVSMGRDDYEGAFGYIQLDAGSELAKALTIHTLVRAGREQEALQVGRPYMPQWKSYAMLLACVEHRPEAEIDALAREVLPDDDPETNYFSAAHLAYCGRTAAAIGLLDRAISGHYCSYPVIETDPLFGRLRDRPEFARIRARAIACRDDFLARRNALN